MHAPVFELIVDELVVDGVRIAVEVTELPAEPVVQENGEEPKGDEQ